MICSIDSDISSFSSALFDITIEQSGVIGIRKIYLAAVKDHMRASTLLTLDPGALRKHVIWSIAQHMAGGGSFRTLIYSRMGFSKGAYVPLYYAGGMDISNACDGIPGEREDVFHDDHRAETAWYRRVAGRDAPDILPGSLDAFSYRLEVGGVLGVKDAIMSLHLMSEELARILTDDWRLHLAAEVVKIILEVVMGQTDMDAALQQLSARSADDADQLLKCGLGIIIRDLKPYEPESREPSEIEASPATPVPQS